jgi:hypothetical protein
VQALRTEHQRDARPSTSMLTGGLRNDFSRQSQSVAALRIAPQKAEDPVFYRTKRAYTRLAKKSIWYIFILFCSGVSRVFEHIYKQFQNVPTVAVRNPVRV